MAQEKNLKNTKICPVCGTRLSENVNRCPVCGTQLNATAEVKKPSAIQPRRLPEIHLNLPAAIGVGVLFVALLGLVIYLLAVKPATPANVGESVVETTPTPTMTITTTPTITLTPTPLPTWTPLPPMDYTVKPDETCSQIAAAFGISVQSIITTNNLDVSCTLSQGQNLKIPQPTLTPSPMPTATVDTSIINDENDCENTITVKVESGWTLSSIALNYNVTMASIREYNHLSNDIVQEGQSLIVPLCERKPTPGPTPTATPAPPYPAPNLLLPRSGASFSADTNAVTLQWASVADLRANELYRITVQDLTSETEKILVVYATDTKYILPSSFRPVDGIPHIIQWTVSVARQINQGTTNPIYEVAGLSSTPRVFSWIGNGTAVTPTP